MGFMLPELTEEHGGAGATLAYQLVVQDELAKAEVPANTAVHTIAAHYILDYGTEAQKRRWLPGLASGELLAGIALTEPGCGSDLKSLRTRARRDGDEYVIDGAKTFITNGFSANLLVVAVRTGEAGSRGVSLVVMETENLPGLSRRPAAREARPACLGHRGAVLRWRARAREQSDRRGGRQGLHPAHEPASVRAPAAVRVRRLRSIELAVELTVEYTKQRKAFGQTLADFQNTRFKLAECATIAHVVRTFLNDCTQRLLDGTLDDEAAYMAKWWCTEQQGKVTDECLQLFGGYGYMSEYPIARLYADARVQRIYGGTTEIMKDLIARKLFA
jgi:acyl-CoA dehydrogenase